MTIEELNRRHEVTGAARFEPGPGGLPQLRLSSQGAVARVFLHGAHVAHFQPAGEEPVLWVSSRSWYRPDKPIRGGIPVCFPWFGANPADASLPMHGFARLAEWSVVSIERLPSGDVEAVLGLEEDGKARPSWTSPFSLRLSVRLEGAALRLRLETTNTGRCPLRITEALHSYFRVADVRRISILGLEGAPYLDTAGGARVEQVQGKDPVTFAAETDRLYRDRSEAVVIVDPVLKRRIRILKSGSATTVVWNPWIEKAHRMEDFGDEEWPGMVCVETANAEEAAVTVAPGASHAMETVLTVER